MPNNIQVNELSKKFKDITAVDKVSFEVNKSEIFGFLGPNGAGKTTTISMLCTLLKPSAGTALVGGYDIISDPGNVRREIGIVFQDTTLDERLTARENLTFHGELYGMPRAEIGERADALLARVGLTARAGDPVAVFSGGMRRRLELARGLMHKPAVLFLDEPTIGLDPQSRRNLWDYARSLRDSEGVTIFLSTHYMDEAESCDRIAVIDYGEIIALDTPAAHKSALGGDVVSVTGPDLEVLSSEIAQIFDIDSRVENEKVEFNIQQGANFIPILLGKLKQPVDSVSLRHPTLDDVFVSLTGHQIRDGDISNTEKMRNVQRTGWGRRH